MMTSPDTSSTDTELRAARVALEGTAAERLALGARALTTLLRNPDDTRQVFLLGLVANAPAFPRFLARIVASDEGDALLRDRPSIDRKHVDWDALRALPPDTLGGAYARYLDENGLDPDLFQAPPGLPDTVSYIAKRTRQTHDIWHVLTGYKPDVAGEIALQAFTFAQTQMPSSGLIALFGSLKFAPRAPRAVFMTIDGLRRGRRARFLTTVRWEDHWQDTLDDVRRMFGIEPARAAEVRLSSKQVRGATARASGAPS